MEPSINHREPAQGEKRSSAGAEGASNLTLRTLTTELGFSGWEQIMDG